MVKYGVSPSGASASVGYADIYNFSKMFKNFFGEILKLEKQVFRFFTTTSVPLCKVHKKTYDKRG